MSAGYTRVIIVGDARNVETLLPSEQQIGTLMPDVLRLLGNSADGRTGSHRGEAGDAAESADAGPRTVTLTPVGSETLLPQQSLSSAAVRDGAILRLDRRDEQVPAPVVYDLAETTQLLSQRGPQTWSLDLPRMVGALLVTIFLLGGLLLLAEEVQPEQPGWWSLGLAGAALGVLALVPQRRLRSDLELAVLSAAALGLTWHWGLPNWPGNEWTVPIWGGLALIAGQLSHRHWPAALITAAAGGTLGLLWWGTAQFVGDGVPVAAVAGIGTVILIGLAPRAALTLSGMNRLDDEVSHRARPPRQRAQSGFHDAHQGLAGAIVLCAVSVVAAAHALLAAPLDPWGLPLAILLIVLTALRARSMPLAVEQTALVTAAAVATVLLMLDVRGWLPVWVQVLTPVVLAAVPVLLRLVEVPEHVAARLRLNARRVETLATVALLPLLLGLFGLYAQLVDTFQG